MNPDERRILENLSTVAELETWLRCARAELRSDPGDQPLGRFIELVELKLSEPPCSLESSRDAAEAVEPIAATENHTGAPDSS